MPNMIMIDNDGPLLISTNYWQTEAAADGYCYLSGNAGAWRLLLPRPAEDLLISMRTGKTATIEQSLQLPGRCWDVVFEDGSASPFFIAVDKQQVDRAMQPGPCRLLVYTADGLALELECEVKT